MPTARLPRSPRLQVMSTNAVAYSVVEVAQAHNLCISLRRNNRSSPTLPMIVAAISLIGLRLHALCLHFGPHANVLSDARIKVWSCSYRNCCDSLPFLPMLQLGQTASTMPSNDSAATAASMTAA